MKTSSTLEDSLKGALEGSLEETLEGEIAATIRAGEGEGEGRSGDEGDALLVHNRRTRGVNTEAMPTGTSAREKGEVDEPTGDATKTPFLNVVN